MIIKASELTYSDMGRQVKIVSTAWLRKPLPVTYDMSSGVLVFDKTAPLDSPAFATHVYEGVIKSFMFKGVGEIRIWLAGVDGTVLLAPSHEFEII